MLTFALYFPYTLISHSRCAHRRWQYYSFFFRDRQYWLYLNGKSRPRYGDPKLISVLWRGIPNKIDAVVQILRTIICDNFNPPKEQNLIETLFFKGNFFQGLFLVISHVELNCHIFCCRRLYLKRDQDETKPKIGLS